MSRLFTGLRAGVLAIAAWACAAAPAAAQPNTGIHFVLEGETDAPAAAIAYLTLDKGLFAAAGLDVRITTTANPADPIARVASGEADLAIADINALIAYRDQTAASPIKAVFMLYSTPPYAVVGRRSRGISDPKSLEGKRVGAPRGLPTTAQWPLFARVNGIDAAKVVLDNVGVAVRTPMLAAGQVDAALGYGFTVYVNLKDRGVPANDIVLLPMADHGLSLYGSAVIVNPKFAAEKSEAVKSFLRALTQGLRTTVRNPADAVDSLLERNGAATKPVELERLRMAIRSNILTPEVRSQGYGAILPERLDTAIAQLALVQTFKSTPKAEDIFDPSFLPPPAQRRVN